MEGICHVSEEVLDRALVSVCRLDGEAQEGKHSEAAVRNLLDADFPNGGSVTRAQAKGIEARVANICSGDLVAREDGVLAERSRNHQT